jgi:Ca-activated chloride channel family protein
VKAEANNQITLTTIGVGMANYNDVLMEQLADNGDGNYYYVDTDEEARKLFNTDLIGLLEAVAMDAKIQVEFNPAVVDRFRLIGYENRALETEDFRDNTVDAGEVGAGHSVTALYEVRIKDGASGPVATVSIRYRDPDTGQGVERWREVMVDDLDHPFETASPRFRFVASVAEFAEILRESSWAQDGTLEAVRQMASQAVSDMESTSSDREFVSLVQSALRLRR